MFGSRSTIVAVLLGRRQTSNRLRSLQIQMTAQFAVCHSPLTRLAGLTSSPLLLLLLLLHALIKLKVTFSAKQRATAAAAAAAAARIFFLRKKRRRRRLRGEERRMRSDLLKTISCPRPVFFMGCAACKGLNYIM